jgi:hypothetical protein
MESSMIACLISASVFGALAVWAAQIPRSAAKAMDAGKVLRNEILTPGIIHRKRYQVKLKRSDAKLSIGGYDQLWSVRRAKAYSPTLIEPT